MAQEQLDKVTGRSRVLSFADAEYPPYIWAIIKEIYSFNSSLCSL